MVHQLIEASLGFDKESFEKVVNNLVIRIGLEKAIIHVFYPFLNRIGLLWMTNHVIPAQEHFCSHIIRKKIICAIDGLDIIHPGNNRDNVVIFSPIGELHEIPLLVTNFFLRKHGIRTTYFGTNVSLDTLKYYASNHPVTHLHMHVITYLDHIKLDCLADQLSKSFPKQEILVSGPACACLVEKAPNLVHLHEPDDLIKWAESLAKGK